VEKGKRHADQGYRYQEPRSRKGHNAARWIEELQAQEEEVDDTLGSGSHHRGETAFFEEK